MINATEKLRQMLDEHGTEYTIDDGMYVKATSWLSTNGKLATFAEYNDGSTTFSMDSLSLTPGQAIAVTLGESYPYEQCITGDGSNWGEIMVDETTLLPCPMCGAAWPSVQVRWIGFTHTHNGAFSAGYRGECCDCGLTTRAFNDEAEAIEAWNTRVQLDDENLTAEQVCECAETVYFEGYNDGSINRGSHIDETDWQAIADKLNATLGGGECKNVSKLNKDGVAGYYFTCSECGLSICASMGIGEIELKSPLSFVWKHGVYEFERCPRCGKVVK